MILEAATRKIPTFASDYIAMKDSIRHNIDGWLFENGNVEDFKEKLNVLVSKPDQILKISKKINQPHSMDEVAALVGK